MDNHIQKLIYSLFGTSPVIGTPIREQLRLVNERVPPVFKHREMDDLGCGDGRITCHLKEVFQPARLRGFDVYPALVKRAKKRGIQAEIMDLETKIPQGELAVMWGVLHHLKDAETCLKRIAENYRMAFIREPIKENHHTGLEMGEPFLKEKVESWVNHYLCGAQFFYYNGCIFVFYNKR
ncbi:MAG TPA: class I SAM-dependent methyltransferase [Dehalococcoidales bacterium]|nr:class I SAM-dependent methyltransferase [Dehalococcoidales bacterium]